MESIIEFKKKILSYIDARHGNVCGAIYDTTKNKFLKEEAIYILDELKENDYEVEHNEDTYVVDPFNVLKNKEEVTNPDLLVPNYLRDTEAERNLNDKKI